MQEGYQPNTTTKNWKVLKHSKEETELWQALIAGDRTAFMLIYQQYFSKLYSYGIKVCQDNELVQDCIQDLYVDLWNQRKNLSDTDSITYYLFAALRRRILKELKRNTGHDYDLSSHLLYVSDASTEDIILLEELTIEKKEKVAEAMQKLTKRQREVIKLRYYQNVNNEEIAERLSIKVESTYNLISKAIQLLKKHLIKSSLLISIFF